MKPLTKGGCYATLTTGRCEEVTVVSQLGGNMILSIKDSRIALDRTMAMRIMV